MKTDHDVPFLESNIIKNFFAFVFHARDIMHKAGYQN